HTRFSRDWSSDVCSSDLCAALQPAIKPYIPNRRDGRNCINNMETSIILVSEKLDNPVWSSLSENHDKFCLNFGKVKFYNPEYCPFGAFVDQNISTDAMEEYSHQSNNFFVVGNKPTELPQNLELKNELVCNQMIIETPITIEFTEDVVLLNEKFQRELIELVNLVQPGFFKEKTVQLG